MSYYIQIGAGAGDQDARVNFKDGFTKFVKNIKLDKNDKILLIEANPLNIKKLQECWKNYENTKIFNLALVDKNFSEKDIKLYYTEDDRPCYQVTSLFYSHVKKHYPTSKILELHTETKNINSFLNTEVGNDIIKYLAIDAEGIDFDLMMDIDYQNFDIQNISFEVLHLNLKQKKKIKEKLMSNGYSYFGRGFDPHGYDLMFKKKMNPYLWFKTKFFVRKLKK